MVKSITLTASMRSNLNSLKNISKQMNTTQERLSTGKKVNSAIDNASSYYQARALTNRASDLDALLDAMGQGIQTIQAATQGLTSGVSFLEQASAIATEALAATKIPSKEWFEAQVGENGVVVTTAQELKDAVNSGKETICVYGKIDYLETLSLKTGQKLVGTEYYTGYTGQEKFSQINFVGNQVIAIDIQNARNVVISDLSVSHEIENADTARFNTISAGSSELRISNVDIHSKVQKTTSDGGQGAISSLFSKIDFDGKVNIDGQGKFGGGLFLFASQVVISDTAELNLRTSKIGNTSENGIMFYQNSTVDIYGRLNIKSNETAILFSAAIDYGGNKLNVHSEAVLNIDSPVIFGMNTKDENPSVVDLAAGCKLNAKNGDKIISLESEGTQIVSAPGFGITLSKLETLSGFKKTNAEVDWDNFPPFDISTKEIPERESLIYNNLFEQYDKLINDSSYQGVNLLKNEKLDVIFNETRNNKLTVQGQDMSSASLGLTKAEWTTQGDIANSIQELLAAVNKIRTFQSELGNNYSIIQTRQNFTEALTDVLETGADNLVLADMNEESANYLALQTRQQLATNALSLAANSAQSVLALFG